MTTETAGTIVGITEAFCIYQFAKSDELGVANWRDVALVNVCPAEPLLPADVAENDRRNGRATILRELLTIRHCDLTSAESQLREEVIGDLCGGNRPYG